MASRRLSMRKIKEVLRLKWHYGRSNHEIATSCNIARSTVREYVRRAEMAGLSRPLDPSLDDATLENLLFPINPAIPSSPRLTGTSKREGSDESRAMQSCLKPPRGLS